MTDVEIASTALVLIGDRPITSLNENSDRAVACKLFYNDTRDEVLRAHPWKFAKKRTTLSPLVDPPDSEWSYRYQLPTDPYCLRVLRLADVTDEFTIEGRELLTNISTAKLLYIARVTDSQQFDSLFNTAFAYRLAHKLARAITSKTTLSTEMFQLYQQSLREARAISGQEGTPEVISAETFIEVR